MRRPKKGMIRIAVYDAIKAAGYRKPYEFEKHMGFAYGCISRFLSGKRGMEYKALERVMHELGLEVRKKQQGHPNPCVRHGPTLEFL